MAPDLLTEAEAAVKLRMGARTLRELRRAGKIRYVELTERKKAYRLEDIEEYVAARVRVNEPCETQPKPKRRDRQGYGKIIPFSKLVG
jgi:aryl-alcohol dehydrogenase-like predicted oxidoreductase